MDALKLGVALMAGVVASVGQAQEKPMPEPGSAKTAVAASVNLNPVVHEREFDVPVERLWRTFATEEGWKDWGVAQCKLDLRPGGKVQTHYNPKGVIGDEGTIENEVLAFDPLHSFSFRISKPPKGFHFMNAYKGVWSVATMTDLGNGRSRLRLAMNGYTAEEESQKMRAFFEQGNAWSLDKLKATLEGGSAKAEAKVAAPQGELDPIVVEAVIPAMPGDVWKCWATEEGMKSFMTDCKIELKIGGAYELYFGGKDVPAGERGSEGCKVLSYEPGRMLSFTWNAPPKFAHARAERTWVVVHVEPHGAHATKVTLKHYGFAEKAAEFPGHAGEWKEARAYFANAWPHVTGALKAKFGPGEKSAK
jgi:uncharacterized protein YndB with AHSA1/START domain